LETFSIEDIMASTSTTLEKPKKNSLLNEIEYGPIRESDLQDLSRLISGMRPYSTDQVRVRDFSSDYFHWIYFRNPAGRAFTCCARHQGKLVCSFAIAPKRIQMGNERLVMGKTMEMFTHPQYQGNGLITGVAERVFDAAGEAGIDMWYVTPSVNSYPIFRKKWGYIEAFTNHYVIKVLRPSALLSTMVRPRILGKIVGLPIDLALRLQRLFSSTPPEYAFEEVSSFGPETDALWERSKGYGLALVRDAQYMNWRYIDNPDSYISIRCNHRSGELAGTLVLKKTIRRGLPVGEIVDYLCPPEDSATRRALFLHGIERLQREGCVFAQSWAIEGTPLAREMKRAGFNLKRKKLPILLSPAASKPNFYNPEAWLLTQGDGNDL
ncbi:MAG: GNAT family N-acetyltransferase, partial [Planctomycetes bacterium]|nr:GNAT family N-acetyltransferase [Planctomycetota bacterium]